MLILSGMLILLLTGLSAHAQQNKKIIVLGDSLSAAYGINPNQSWVNLLSAYIAQSNLEYEVINVSISGDTTESGLNRLPSVIKNNQPHIAIMIIALGANDGLRGLNPDLVQANLASMISLCQQNDIKVLLVGMYMPPNYGEAYTKSFTNLYRNLMIEYKVRLIPFMLGGVITKANMMQEDGMHPNEQGQPMIFRNILSGLRPMLRN